MIGALIIVVLIMTLSAVIVSSIIFSQNRQTSYSFLNQSISIIREDVRSKVDAMQTHAHQMATADTLSAQLNLLSMIDRSQELNMVGKEALRNVAISMYTICSVAGVDRSAMFDLEGRLLAFVVKRGNAYEIGYPLKSGFEIAVLEKDVKLDEDSWKQTSQVAGIPRTYAGEIPKDTQSDFAIIRELLSMVTLEPVMISKFNIETAQYEPAQIAFLSVVDGFGKSFVNRLGSLTGTQVNIFTEKGQSVGQLVDYDQLDFSIFPQNQDSWRLTEQEVVLSDIDLQEKSYFQGLLPIYSQSRPIAAIAALYSTDIAMDNTWQIITILSVVSLGCVLIIIPFSYFISGFIAKPMIKLSQTLTTVDETGDFSHRTEVVNWDETGRIAMAFNGLMDSLQSALGATNLVMRSVAGGDLSQSINGEFKGELKELQRNTNESIQLLSQAISQVQSACGQVNIQADDMSGSVKTMADSTMNQAGTIEEISSTLNIIADQIRENSENATQAQSFSKKTIETVKKGNQQMDEMLKSIRQINDTSAEVSKIVKVIDEIAFQTNLLALNAAVEAARAGKYGKGFAVVAEEVRNLANRSASAVKNTTGLIDNSLKQVEAGVAIADRTAELLNEITTEIEKSVALIDRISEASKEQSLSIAETNSALSQLSQGVQTNSGVSEKSSYAVRELSDLAANLRELLQRFTTINAPLSAPQLETRRPLMIDEDQNS